MVVRVKKLVTGLRLIGRTIKLPWITSALGFSLEVRNCATFTQGHFSLLVTYFYVNLRPMPGLVILILIH